MYVLSLIWGFYQRLFWWLGRKRQERPFANGLAVACAFIGSIFVFPWILHPVVPAGITFVGAMVFWGPLLLMYFSQD
ncbi:hypothetical protein [Pelagibius sp.]|uniref:hypothetical protein n=1 Tax=Pelagibius sp. TaxID=1931238 RepID=UPI0026201D7C|nr:hypothetical protein [Pelagibius sp.]